MSEQKSLFGLTTDEVLMMAIALEYECDDKIQNKVNKILEKIEHELHVDALVGHRLYEHGRIMGWLKEH